MKNSFKVATTIRSISALIFATWLFLPQPRALAQVPQKISYQGYLSSTSGAPITNPSLSIVFKIYNVPVGGFALFTETQTVPVTNGLFNVVLGTNSALTLPFDVQYYLGVTVAADAELTPRQPLTSAPYALNAATVVDGAITLPKIAANGCVVGQTMLFNGAAWVCGTGPAATTMPATGITGTLNAAQLPSTVAAVDDARFSDARAPLGGSAAYIQNQNISPQTANLSISGTAAVGNNVSVGGSVKIGTDPGACDGTKAGAMRWNSGTNAFDACDGSQWRPFGVHAAFSAFANSPQSLSSSAWTKVAFGTTAFDMAGNYNNVTSIFTATSGGTFQFNATVVVQIGTMAQDIGHRIVLNGSPYLQFSSMTCAQPGWCGPMSGSTVMVLNANDQVTVEAYCGYPVSCMTGPNGGMNNAFSAVRIY